MTVCPYYTPPALADFLVSKIPIINAKRVLDLCVGSGNLLAAARVKWSSTFLVGVDLDPNAVANCTKRFSAPALFTQGDARLLYPGVASNSCRELATNDFDVVLANPPFTQNDESTQFSPPELDSLASSVDWGSTCRRVEGQLLVHNILYVRDGGYLVAIIPNGVLSCDRFAGLRKWIIMQSELLKVIRLPENMFTGSEVSASALILKKKSQKGTSEPVDFTLLEAKVRADTIVAKTIYKGKLNPNTSNTRLDTVYRFPESIGNYATLKDFASIIRRGAFIPKSNLGLAGSCHYIHSTSIRGGGLDLNNRLGYVMNERIVKTKVYVGQGDILIVRVGKTLGTVGIVADSTHGGLTSGCLFLVRPNGINPYSLALLLQCEVSQRYYRAVARGTAARFLTYADIRETPIPLVSAESLSEFTKEYEATLKFPFPSDSERRRRLTRIKRIVDEVNSAIKVKW